ncbi:MAG: glycosyltransferase family 4 protein [Armatimonadetes bacterium]|nr:glycosyltransferase family 4 protein [Armatimonadota bacterium]
MRVAIIYLGKSGGISHCTLELGRALSELADVTCYLPIQNTMLDDFKVLPCKVKVFPMHRGYRILLWALLTGRDTTGVVSEVLRDAPDVVLDTGSGGWANVVAGHLYSRVPVAAMLHDPERHPGLTGFLNEIPDWLCPMSAQAVVSLSKYAHRIMARKYPNKVHIESRHGLIMSNEHIEVDKIAALRKRLLFFGRIEPYKGLDVLLEAFEIAREDDSSLRLDVVGAGKLGRRMRGRILDLGVGLTNRFISDSDLREVLADHGLMVLPYTSATQSGVAAVALANGMPCIATNTGALPEQVIHGRNGLIVPPRNPEALAEAILTITSSLETAKRMSGESLSVGTELYSWSIIGNKLADDLKTLAAG